ncbi:MULTISPECIES: AMP-binding protein [Burkholderia]|uniref:AMP-binding protein n=1 Tax=Burkholderia TaxID=32008 RepID=UPI000841C0DC|nr:MULTISPECIES: AMP-binding protein [unclassified Burkholderia]AOK32224.1 long-chain fatty acid--CoA ligase [Burkholderia sp. Bp7605]
MSTKPWLASYGNVPETIDADAYRSMTHLLDDAMRKYAARPAFRSFGQTLTYADVDRLSRDLAAYLQQRLGVRKGDRVAVMLPNLLAFPIALLGIARLGAVQVNVNPLYTARELSHQLNDAGAEVLIVFSGSTPVIADVLGEVRLKHILTVGVGDGSPAALPSPPVDARLPDTIAFVQALAEGAALAFEPANVTGDDLLFLQYTGGTTGLSKGTALTHRNLVANTLQFREMMAGLVYEEDEVIVTALPLYHVFALTVNFITYFSIGGENWLVANPRDIPALIDVIAQSRMTSFMGVNTLYAALAMQPAIKSVDFSRLRLSGGGGSAILPTTSARWQEVTGTFIREGYGLSETSPVVSFNPASATSFTGTVGVPLSSTDVKLIKEDGSEAALGESGEICVKGPQVFSGYWNQPEATRQAFTTDGYFRTGDIGTFDERGFLRIVDRVKDMVIVSGFNVYPNEVEAVAAAYPGVAECACIGVPSDKTGEAVKLFVVPCKDASLTEEAVIEHCRKELAAYKVPKYVVFVDDLPKSTVGKILRRELRQQQA